MVPVHDCVHTSLENEYFKQKLTEFYKENKRLKEELDLLKNIPTKDVEETPRSETSTQTSSTETFKGTGPKGATTCSVCCNRMNGKAASGVLKASSAQENHLKQAKKDETKHFDNDIFNKQNKKSYVKLCEMQHNLLKKYEDEVNLNAVKQDLINHMKIEIDQLTQKCQEKENETSELAKRLEQLDELKENFKSLLLDYETCKIKCKKYKTELKCFDEKFFDELEDLKYNFYESIKLNKHYEQLLFKLDKSDLIDDGSTCKKKNRVKFVEDTDSPENGQNNRQGRLSDLMQSFESMNRNYKKSASIRTDEEDSVETSQDSAEEFATTSEDDFRNFNFEDYLDGGDVKNDETLDYKELIEQLTK